MGWAVGGTIGSIMADYIGRKKMLMISIAGYCAFTALTAFSHSLTALIAWRFLTGMFLGSEWSTGTALVAENLAGLGAGEGSGSRAIGIWLRLLSGSRTMARDPTIWWS